MDNLTIEMLDTLEPGELDKLSPAVLNDLAWKLAEEQTVLKRRDKALHDAFERRYAGRASEELLKDSRDTGTVHFTDGHFDVTVTRPKRVKWDQPALLQALDKLDPDTAKHVAKITVKVDERRFDALMSDSRAVLLPARTVESGKATYALSERVAA